MKGTFCDNKELSNAFINQMNGIVGSGASKLGYVPLMCTGRSMGFFDLMKGLTEGIAAQKSRDLVSGQSVGILRDGVAAQIGGPENVDNHRSVGVAS